MNQPSSEELLRALRDRFAEVVKAEKERVEEERDFLLAVLQTGGYGGRTSKYTNQVFSDIYLIDELDKFRLS